MMPPAGARPSRRTPLDRAGARRSRRAWTSARAANPNPGWRPFQRLNRAEYARAVKDLLGVDVDVTAFLPPDTISHGFDNVADVQTFSPTLMEGYLRAASRVTALAIGDPEPPASEAHLQRAEDRVAAGSASTARRSARAAASRSIHTFPADGEYVFRMDLLRRAARVPVRQHRHRASRSRCRSTATRVALLDINPRMTESTTGLSLKIAAGARARPAPQRVTAAFLQRFDGPVNDLIAPIEHTLADTEIGIAFGITTLPHLRRPQRRRPAPRHRRVRHGEPPQDLHAAGRRRQPTSGRARRRSSAAWPTQAFRRPVDRPRPRSG